MGRTKAILLIILIAGLGLRLTYVATTGNSSLTQSRDGEIAHNIVAHGRWFVYNERARYALGALTKRLGRSVDPEEVDYSSLDKRGLWYPESGEPIGSSVVLAGMWQLTGGERYLPLQILQAIVDAACALLVYRIAMRLFDARRVATIAASLYALYPPIAWMTIDPYDDIWAVDFTIAVVAIYLELRNSEHRWRWLAACGLLTGIGTYFRPAVLILPPILALATIAWTGWREALRSGACITLIAALLMVPWTIRNYNDFHAFIPVTSSAWENMWGGLGELPNNFGATLGTKTTTAEVRRVRPDLRPESPAWDSYLKGWVVRAIEQHPLFYLEVLAHRIAVATLWKHDQLWMHRGVAPLLAYQGGLLAFVANRPLDLLQYALQPLVFLLAMLVLGLTWRRRRRQHLVLMAVVLSVLLPYIAVHVENRYVLPAEFAYFIWIGLGADLLLMRFKGCDMRAVRT